MQYLFFLYLSLICEGLDFRKICGTFSGVNITTETVDCASYKGTCSTLRDIQCNYCWLDSNAKLFSNGPFLILNRSVSLSPSYSCLGVCDIRGQQCNVTMNNISCQVDTTSARKSYFAVFCNIRYAYKQAVKIISICDQEYCLLQISFIANKLLCICVLFQTIKTTTTKLWT